MTNMADGTNESAVRPQLLNTTQAGAVGSGNGETGDGTDGMKQSDAGLGMDETKGDKETRASEERRSAIQPRVTRGGGDAYEEATRTPFPIACKLRIVVPVLRSRQKARLTSQTYQIF